jgi:heme-degrading monooxygenase HmoA
MSSEACGAVVTIFRSRLRSEAVDEYGPLAERILALARSTPGFVSFDSYSGRNGERVSIIVFADEPSHAAWRSHPEHRRAQEAGRRRLYEWYQIQVCRLVDEYRGPPATE